MKHPFLIALGLCLSVSFAHAQTGLPQFPVSPNLPPPQNIEPSGDFPASETPAAPPNFAPVVPQIAPRNDAATIEATLLALESAVNARDANALQIVGLQTPAQYVSLAARLRLRRLSIHGDHALARQNLEISGVTIDNARKGQRVAQLLKSGAQDIALQRAPDGSWNLSGATWSVADATFDALQILASTARDEWDDLRGAANANARPDEVILHLVAERRGGRWIALRRSRWNGRALSPQVLARRESAQQGIASPTGIPPASADEGDSTVRAWILSQMTARSKSGDEQGGTLHLLLQPGARNWVGLDGVWEPHLSDAAPLEIDRPAPLNENPETASRAPMLRDALNQSTTAFDSAAAHLDFARALEASGVFEEAADEYQKAAWLEPNVVEPRRLAAAQERRSLDPANRARIQLSKEAKVGLVADHPTFVISALNREQKIAPTPLRALRLGMEFSKLGDDDTAARYLEQSRALLRQGAFARLSADDAAWVQVLSDHLEQRRELAPIKPPNLIRSQLFTVRCRLDDASALPLLAALEAAQHTVYTDFGIPMGTTEVVLWRTQAEFQAYTTRFSAQGSSEFVAALTLTKLIATERGPLVLGEEVNAFVDDRLRQATFGTLAHEYGHVAVRQMSNGRNVPVWFNEGVATMVEGGYDGYLPRVREARRAKRLLSMAALREWNVDGERAFLAYSQANSILDFIVAHWGGEAVLNILRQIGKDVPPDTAFVNVIGVDSNQLWQRWASEGIG